MKHGIPSRPEAAPRRARPTLEALAHRGAEGASTRTAAPRPAPPSRRAEQVVPPITRIRLRSSASSCSSRASTGSPWSSPRQLPSPLATSGTTPCPLRHRRGSSASPRRRAPRHPFAETLFRAVDVGREEEPCAVLPSLAPNTLLGWQLPEREPQVDASRLVERVRDRVDQDRDHRDDRRRPPSRRSSSRPSVSFVASGHENTRRSRARRPEPGRSPGARRSSDGSATARTRTPP